MRTESARAPVAALVTFAYLHRLARSISEVLCLAVSRRCDLASRDCAPGGRAPPRMTRAAHVPLRPPSPSCATCLAEQAKAAERVALRRGAHRVACVPRVQTGTFLDTPGTALTAARRGRPRLRGRRLPRSALLHDFRRISGPQPGTRGHSRARRDAAHRPQDPQWCSSATTSSRVRTWLKPP